VVDVRFRFPNTFAGAPGLEVASSWVVMSGRRDLALLSLTEVHRHFQMRTFELDTYFIPWATLRGAQQLLHAGSHTKISPFPGTDESPK
jgi:hypothetical protein